MDTGEGSALPPGVACIRAPNPSVYTGLGTNTYLVEGSDGCTAIDPGPRIEAHLRRVARRAAPRGTLRRILVTHGHPDHAEGAAWLSEHTGAPVLAWPSIGVADPDTEQTPGPGSPGGQGTTSPCGDLVPLHTPGHRHDHLCFLLPDRAVLFAGDLLAGTGTVVIAPPEGDMAAYLRSLRRLLDLDLRLILPGHGPPIGEPRAAIAGYLRHRQEREEQILAGLLAGLETVEALVARIYAGQDPAVYPRSPMARERRRIFLMLAGQTVTAHLLKLEGEGRVARLGGTPTDATWRPAMRSSGAG